MRRSPGAGRRLTEQGENVNKSLYCGVHRKEGGRQAKPTKWVPGPGVIRVGGQWPRVTEFHRGGGWVWALDWLVCMLRSESLTSPSLALSLYFSPVNQESSIWLEEWDGSPTGPGWGPAQLTNMPSFLAFRQPS